MPPDPPSWWSDELAHEVRTALTTIKVHAQLIRRVAWPTSDEQHCGLHESAGAIDAAATTALRHLNRLLSEHAARWPDGALAQPPGAESGHDRDAAPEADPSDDEG